MPEEMDPYSDAGPAQSPAESPESKGEETESPRGLLPKSILAGKDFKPGEEIVLKIVAIHDDEVEVEYAKDDADNKESYEEGSGESSGAGAGSEMSGMME